MAPVDPFARGALRASAHPARAVAARSQRAHNLAESRTPARTRQVGLRGMGDKALTLCFRPKACCFRLWPGAQWHLTWRPPTPTRQNPIQTRQTSIEDAALPIVGASMLLEPACLRIRREPKITACPDVERLTAVPMVPRRCAGVRIYGRSRGSGVGSPHANNALAAA